MKVILGLLFLFSLSFLHAADGKAPEGIPASYPLKTCAVSGEAFGGEMGKPVKVTHEGTDVYLCCKSCLKDFKKDPAKYIKKIEEAEKKDKK